MNSKTKELGCQAEKERILVKVLKIKRQQYQEKKGYVPNPLELDEFEEWEDRLEVRPWCDRKNHVFFKDVLTSEVRPFRCNQLRCGCQECTRGYMEKRRKWLTKAILENVLDRMITITLDPKTVAGKTQDEKRVNAWAMLPDQYSRVIKSMIYYLKKWGWSNVSEIKIIHWFEPHKNLMPHIHIYTNQFFPYEILVKICKKYSLGASHQKRYKMSKKTVNTMGQYGSKLILSPTEGSAKRLAEYAAKEAKTTKQKVDEKFFDKRAIHYIPKRMRLIGCTRNIKKEVQEKNIVSPWALMTDYKKIEIEEAMTRQVEILLEKITLGAPAHIPIRLSQYLDQLHAIVKVLEDSDNQIKISKQLKKDLVLFRTTHTEEQAKAELNKEIELYVRQSSLRKLVEKYEGYLQRLQEEYRLRNGYI